MTTIHKNNTNSQISLPFTAVECAFDVFCEKTEGKEGLVFIGCDNPTEWIQGLDKVLPDGFKRSSGIYEDEFLVLKTTGGRTDLVYTFKKNADMFGTSICTWRLSFGDCSWISDYKNNYRDQHW